MNKTEITTKLGSLDLTEDVLALINEELASYPEELQDEDLKKLDTFLSELQQEEMEDAMDSEKIAAFLEDASEQMDENLENFTHDSLKSMRDGLSMANDVVDSVS
jgi:hypothetical protein